MRDFSNKQLRSDKMGLGRNQQVMAKERERVHLEQRVEMPLSRNVRRQLGDGSKEIEKAVERAKRKGLLASRSQVQVDKQVAKGRQKMEELKEKVLEDRLTVLPISEKEEPAPADPEPPVVLPLPTAAIGLQVPERSAERVPGDTTLPSPNSIGGGGAAAVGRGRAGGRAGRGAGRARGTIIGGRRVPKSARAL